jgi:RNA polymerase sigma factor (sigma-70 family)
MQEAAEKVAEAIDDLAVWLRSETEDADLLLVTLPAFDKSLRITDQERLDALHRMLERIGGPVSRPAWSANRGRIIEALQTHGRDKGEADRSAGLGAAGMLSGEVHRMTPAQAVAAAPDVLDRFQKIAEPLFMDDVLGPGWRTKREALASYVEEGKAQESPAERLYAQRQARILLEGLDLREREAVEAFYGMKDLEDAEIARKHGVQEATVRQWRSRAMSKLREMLGG